MSFLGLDMGGTATRWVLLGDAGAEIGRGTAPGANAHLFTPGALAAFEGALAAIRAALPGPPVQRVHAGVTGYGPSSQAAVAEATARALGLASGAVSASDDVELAFHATFAPGAGHLVMAGTGSIGVSVAAGGSVTRVGGRGILIDDAGGGAWIALRALDRLYRAIDADGDARAAPLLAEALAAAMGGAGWDVARAFVYGGERGRIGQLAPAVATAAEGGCALACGLLSEAGAELARLASALIGRCGAAPVAAVGGVLRLSPLVRAGLAAGLPDGIPLAFPTPDAAAAAAAIARERGLK